MARRKLTPLPEDNLRTVTVNSASGLNLREAPAYDAPVLRVLRDGESITINTAKTDPAGWLAVDGGGYVMARYVSE